MKLTAIVSGKVQGVGYRDRIDDIANALGLKGMVENQKDGQMNDNLGGKQDQMLGK